MARVTVEDCVEKLPNRFELVMVAAQRARKIGSGAALTLKEEIIRGKQRIIAMDDDGEDVVDSMEGEEEWKAMARGAGSIDMNSDEDEEEDDAEPGLEDMAGADAPEEA